MTERLEQALIAFQRLPQDQISDAYEMISCAFTDQNEAALNALLELMDALVEAEILNN